MPDIKEITSLLQNLTDKDLALIQKAYTFAQKTHEGHLRKNNEPYFNHLFATAKNIAELGMGSTTIAAGFLHDSIEDVNVTPEEIRKEFGDEVLFLVEGVTKLGKIKYQGTTRYNESLRKLFVAMSQDIRVLIIKLCDRLHNMQTLDSVPNEKQLRIAKETLEIYAPIAYRLGIKKLQRDLEDLAFAYIFPEDFEKTKKILKAKKGEVEANLENFEKSLKKELAKNGVTNFSMDHRVKSLYSLYKKLQKYKGDVEAIYDISALRITLPEIADCYRVLGIIHGAWRPLPERIKDYIASPKLNGYRSIHTTIFTGDGAIVEVQIRTEEMHKEAEFGIASHISYKEGAKKKTTNPNLLWIKKILPEKRDKDLKSDGKGSSGDIPSWVKELVEYQKEAGDEFLDHAKSDFFEERIFVFTPKGDVIDLPKDSSIIDFAFAIHTDIGSHLSGAKVNGKFLSITSTLQNGDRVEIETKKNAKPSYKWLEFCKTTMAKRRINNYLDNFK
ncbi:MAG: bifunctional (p)ppGpp synthetase/guanosine-3',5'-bis(diphosphate) 3'-pyrophosphohydrolase [Candidatus Zambryskibacteria bacterium]|nr:bifunctional (p)ppGpp synthetase/guanosine-3',5'-bis(diphosphate) 3'-pyrophosphohydrolase [Candidatus Zambryskibacteria bacterium]